MDKFNSLIFKGDSDVCSMEDNWEWNHHKLRRSNTSLHYSSVTYNIAYFRSNASPGDITSKKYTDTHTTKMQALLQIFDFLGEI